MKNRSLIITKNIGGILAFTIGKQYDVEIIDSFRRSIVDDKGRRFSYCENSLFDREYVKYISDDDIPEEQNYEEWYEV